MSRALVLRGAHGWLRLQSAGGMIGPAEFNLPERGPIRPLTCPDWHNHPQAQDFPPMLRDLCGDFICLPYGAPDVMAALPDPWQHGAGSGIPEDRWFHGIGANAPWEIIPEPNDPTRAAMVLLPPDAHPVSKLERRVALLPDRPGYEVELRITARHDVQFPVSMHPCFHLPKEPGKLRLEIANAGRGWTYPLPVVPEHAPVAVNARFDSLNAVPRTDGGGMDLTMLPPPERCEALLQIPAPDGEIRLLYDQAGYAIRFAYDAELLPSLVIWISNRGRDEAPFDGNFRTIGIEAVAGAFDLGPPVSNWSGNPIAAEGISTAVPLRAGQELITQSTITIDAL